MANRKCHARDGDAGARPTALGLRDQRRQSIRRGSFTSARELTTAIGAFIDSWNDHPVPFTWTKDADEILGKIKRAKTKQTVLQPLAPLQPRAASASGEPGARFPKSGAWRAWGEKAVPLVGVSGPPLLRRCWSLRNSGRTDVSPSGFRADRSRCRPRYSVRHGPLAGILLPPQPRSPALVFPEMTTGSPGPLPPAGRPAERKRTAGTCQTRSCRAYRWTGPLARMMISATTGGLLRTHLPPDLAPMNTMLSWYLPRPLMPAYAPVPCPIVYVPCWLTRPRQVFGLKVCGPLPGEWVTLNDPFANLNVSTLLPSMSSARAVNAP